jgi:hypothetical protein
MPATLAALGLRGGEKQCLVEGQTLIIILILIIIIIIIIIIIMDKILMQVLVGDVGRRVVRR